MVKYASFNFNDLLKEIQNKAREEGVADKTAYAGIIDQIVDEDLVYGELDPDNNLESIKQKLFDTWEEFDRSRRSAI